jgi:hypothetical protein
LVKQTGTLLELPPITQPRQSVFVLVDESPASRRAVALASLLALPYQAEVVIAGLLPASGTVLDPDVVRPVVTLIEQGMSGDRVIPLTDENERTHWLLRYVLWPLHRQARGMGVPASVCVLRGDDPCAMLAEVVQAAGQPSLLVTSTPASLPAPTRELAEQLHREPPCPLYVADGETGVAREGLVQRLRRRIGRRRRVVDLPAGGM